VVDVQTDVRAERRGADDPAGTAGCQDLHGLP
jgi:hypothetical protein